MESQRKLNSYFKIKVIKMFRSHLIIRRLCERKHSLQILNLGYFIFLLIIKKKKTTINKNLRKQTIHKI